MKKRQYLTAGEVIVEPIPYIEITNIEMTAEKNSHTFMCSKGKIDAADRRKLDFLCQFGSEVVIKTREAAVLFQGLITKLSTQECGGMREI